MCVLSLLFSSVSSAFSSLPPLLSPQLLPLLFFSFLLPLSLSTLSCLLSSFSSVFSSTSSVSSVFSASFFSFAFVVSTVSSTSFPLFFCHSFRLFRFSRFLPPFASFPSSVFWLFLLLSPLSFSSVQKPGQFCLLLVFIPADVSTFYLFCPKARSILGCLSQPPD